MTTRRTTKRRPSAKTAAPAQPLPQHVIGDAERQAKALLAQAEEQAHGLIADARQEADRLAAVVTQAKQDADRVHRDAIEAAARMRTTADQDAQALRETARAEARVAREQADAEAARTQEVADRIADEARQLREQVGAEAGQVVADAQRQAKLIRYDADLLRHQAERELEAARQARQVQRGRRRGRLAVWTWSKAPWAALCAAVGLTASGEYELAHMVGWPGAVAALLPVTIDVWAVTAFHRGRDVKAALAMMIGTNAVYHLAERGMFGVDSGGRPAWWLIILTASIAPIVVWRVHQLIGNGPDFAPTAPPTAREPEAPTRLHAVPPPGSPTALPPVAPSGSPTARTNGSPSRRPAQRTTAKPSAKATDEELIAAARQRAADGTEPSATWLMNTYGVGATRAARIRDAAKAAAGEGR